MSAEAVFIPQSPPSVYFASQSSPQSVTKHRGITNSRNGSLSPFCEAAGCRCADDLGSRRGLKPSVPRRQAGVRKHRVTPSPRGRTFHHISGGKEQGDLLSPHAHHRHGRGPARLSSRVTLVGQVQKTTAATQYSRDVKKNLAKPIRLC